MALTPISADHEEFQLPPVQVLRPILPSVEALLSFLRRIDATRTYSNYGPLWNEFRTGFSAWLAARAAASGVRVVPTGSGTTAIKTALRARSRHRRRIKGSIVGTDPLG